MNSRLLFEIPPTLIQSSATVLLKSNKLNCLIKKYLTVHHVVFWSYIANYFKHLQGLGLFVRANNSLHEVYRSLQYKLKVPCLSLSCIPICSRDEYRIFFFISLEEWLILCHIIWYNLLHIHITHANQPHQNQWYFDSLIYFSDFYILNP